MKIITHYWAKPIPLRNCDWSAVTEDYDGADPIGYGRTEAEAIEDLMEQLEAREDDSAWHEFTEKADANSDSHKV